MIARITDRVFEPDDDALGQNEVPYLLKDLYTVAGLADERGWPVERYDYDAYGKVHMERVAVLPWAADFDGDGDVDQNDLTVFLDAYGGSGQAPNGPRGWRADLDGDGDVDGSDYVLFADAYNGAGNPPRRPQSPAVSAGCVLTTGSMVVGRVGNPFFFTGRRLDVFDKQDAGTPHHFTDDYVVLQLYDFRARTMDPVLGRFGQRDLLGVTVAVVRVRSADTQTSRFSSRIAPQLQYQHGSSVYEYAVSSPERHTDSQGLFIDASGKECDIKACRRWANWWVFPIPDLLGHSWIELPDGTTLDWPSYPTYHNWLTSCNPVSVMKYGRIPTPDGGSKSTKCATCDEIQQCLKNAQQWVNQNFGPDWGIIYNCVTAKNTMLSACGLSDGDVIDDPWDHVLTEY